jgi:hypothetical protein
MRTNYLGRAQIIQPPPRGLFFSEKTELRIILFFVSFAFFYFGFEVIRAVVK